MYFLRVLAGGCVGLNYIHTCYIRIQGRVVLGDLFAKSCSDIGASLPTFHTYTYKIVCMYCTLYSTVYCMYEYSILNFVTRSPGTNFFVPKLSKERRKTNLFIPKLSQERRQIKVFVQLSKERNKTNAFVP
jgi:hypothetical protein